MNLYKVITLLIFMGISPWFLNAQLDLSVSHLKAEPIGGKHEFKRIIDQEMIYPDTAFANNTNGDVTLCFLVRKDSLVDDLKVFESAGEELDCEAIRIFKKTLWKPAFYQGKPLTTYNCVKISFNRKKFEKLCQKRGYTSIDGPQIKADSSQQIYAYFSVTKNPKPVFKEKSTNLVKFISNEIKYPAVALKNNISGTVKIRFVVEPNGMITNIHPVKIVSGGCTEEVIRVIKLLKWQPGIKNDMAVRTWVELTLNFNLVGSGQYQIVPVLAKGLLN